MTNPRRRLWAAMIEKGCHDDYNNPPAIPLVLQLLQITNIGDALVNAATIFANAYAVQPPQPTGSPSKTGSAKKYLVLPHFR